MIAIFIMHGMYALKDLKNSLKTLGSMLIGLLAALFLVSACVRTLDMEIDSEKTYGMAHFAGQEREISL